MRRAACILFLAVGCATLRAAGPMLLEKSVENWLGERDHWAFTQRAVEFEGGARHERVERYDPSRPGDERWQLLSIDGHAPTEQQHAAWAKKKFRKNHHRFDSPVGDFFDFDHATVASESPKGVAYIVPLRGNKSWLFPTDKVDVTVMVNKSTGGLEHLTARVREPFKVLLGIARITGGALDLTFDASADSPGPETAQPSGAARASISRLGEHVEFTWTDFQRVNPAPGLDATADAER